MNHIGFTYIPILYNVYYPRWNNWLMIFPWYWITIDIATTYSTCVYIYKEFTYLYIERERESHMYPQYGDFYIFHMILNHHIYIYIYMYKYIYHHVVSYSDMIVPCISPMISHDIFWNDIPMTYSQKTGSSGFLRSSSTWRIMGELCLLPSGKHTKRYWKWPFIVSFPIKNCDFP